MLPVVWKDEGNISVIYNPSTIIISRAVICFARMGMRLTCYL